MITFALLIPPQADLAFHDQLSHRRHSASARENYERH